jgi:hypothetical protein
MDGILGNRRKGHNISESASLQGTRSRSKAAKTQKYQKYSLAAMCAHEKLMRA